MWQPDPGRDRSHPDDLAIRAVRQAGAGDRQRDLDAAYPVRAGLVGRRRMLGISAVLQIVVIVLDASSGTTRPAITPSGRGEHLGTGADRRVGDGRAVRADPSAGSDRLGDDHGRRRRFRAAGRRLAAGTLFLASEPSYVLASIDIAAVPLFSADGRVRQRGRILGRYLCAAAAFLGHRRGGLAYATIGGSAAFGAICGSCTATAATFAKIALPQMLGRGYSPSFSAGAIAAGGTLKSLIPPSLVMILYCVVAKTFIFDLFVAAIIPALITIALNLIAIAIVVRSMPQLRRSASGCRGASAVAARRAAPALVLMLGVFGGLYSGVFTVNEAASVAAVLAFVFAAAAHDLGRRCAGLVRSGPVSAMLYVILMGAPIFTYFITLAHVPESLIKWIDGHHFPPLGVILR